MINLIIDILLLTVYMIFGHLLDTQALFIVWAIIVGVMIIDEFLMPDYHLDADHYNED